jgi:hypothetical protein
MRLISGAGRDDGKAVVELTRIWRSFDVSLTVAHITPLISLLAGILILIAPALLNYIVAIYLIVAGAVGLNEIYHFVS